MPRLRRNPYLGKLTNIRNFYAIFDKHDDQHLHVTYIVTFIVAYSAHAKHLQVNKGTCSITFPQTCYTNIFKLQRYHYCNITKCGTNITEHFCENVTKHFIELLIEHFLNIP